MADASINFDALSYNSMRDDLVISEYGRSIHQMVEHCLTIADKRRAQQMRRRHRQRDGQRGAQEGEKDEAEQKLWNQLARHGPLRARRGQPFPKPEPAEKDSAPPTWITPMPSRVWATTARRRST